MMSNQCRKICSKLLLKVPERHRIVLVRRFGLGQGREPETLEAIGKSFHITRERVRQIEADGLKRVKRAMEDQSLRALTNPIFDAWFRHLQSYGGLRAEKDLLPELVSSKEKNQAVFLLTLDDRFEYIRETENTHSLWTIDRDSLAAAQTFLSQMTLALKDYGQPLDVKELFNLYTQRVGPQLAGSLGEKTFFSYLGISKDIAPGPHGLWGLRHWPEISPRGLRDRAYLVYKKEGRPLHFREVARLIEKHGFNRKGRKVLAQSVHNDLIRDPRFVLVGRGMYALQEWGYVPGTVREIILGVLKEAGQPLSKQEICELVLAKRQVKPTTIFLNLQNKEYFSKTEDGKFMPKSRLA